jgi:hypothetical protein
LIDVELLVKAERERQLESWIDPVVKRKKRIRYHRISINIKRGGKRRQATWFVDEAVEALQIL